MVAANRSNFNLQTYLRRLWPIAAAIGFFAIISLAYFSPAVFEGRRLFQQDVAGASGTAQDVRNHEAATGERALWTNSLFGGMPMYQISPSYPSTHMLYDAQLIGTMRTPIDIMMGESWLLFAMLVGFFLFMKSLRVGTLPSVIGAVMWTFSSYFLILIAAGHIWKLTALCFIPPTIAGLIWIYRGKYLAGGAVMAFFTALQIMANHIQMSYYFLFVMVALVVAYMVEAIRQRRVARYLTATAVAIVAGLIGVLINLTNIYHTYQYSHETMRGGSELTLQQADGQPDKATHENTTGLTKDYITRWSYGIGETWTLLIPNTKGGATGYLQANDRTAEIIQNKINDLKMAEFVGSQNHYWGDQPFTSGPVYVGAFVLTLFILGCFIVKGPVKWALLVTTILSILLSWGHNFMPLTSFFIDYFPMYDKFRTVSSILVIAEFTIPALAILALIEFIKRPQAVLKHRTALGVSLGLTAGTAALFAITPGFFFNFLSAAESEGLRAAALQNPLYAEATEALIAVRQSIFRTDALRSLVVILLSAGGLYFHAIHKLRSTVAIAVVGIITLVDLWMVNKRYLSDKDFIEPTQVSAQAQPKTAADEIILRDKDPQYRVMNLTKGDPFSDATTSTWHRSIGGYHAAKLQRYQDLISYRLAKMDMQVYSMLNTRYFILLGTDGQPAVQQNPDAFGPAWLVRDIRWVSDANAEMMALDSAATNLRQTAVINERYATPTLKAIPTLTDSTARIRLTAYAPNKLSYEVQSQQPAIAVFSEIYYPKGWIATIDGKPADILQADYVLRALQIPAGIHRVDFVFDPQSVHITEAIAHTAFWLLVLMTIAAIGLPMLRAKRSRQLKDLPASES